MFQVTYFNPITERRHVLIDEIDKATADAVVAKFGDQGDQYHRLPEVQKESMQPATATN